MSEWDVECVATVGCCRGCAECYGEGLGCHNRPAVELLAAARRFPDTPDDDAGLRASGGTENG